MPGEKSVYQLKVTLDDSKPPIWRRILVPENITLYNLHDILQIVMGWTDSHLHMFTIERQIYGNPEDDEYGDLGTKNENRYRLNQLSLREKSRFSYEYDFGDSWDHTILVEKILSPEKGVHYPVCIKGKRACPPEDVGGVWGYEGFLEAIADPEHEEHDEYLEWIGDDFDPEAFDVDEVNEALHALQPVRGRRTARSGPEDDFDFMPSDEEQKELAEKLSAWAENLNTEQQEVFEALPLRRDMLAFLEYLSENRTVGTQSTGNLPLKAVHAICEKFVKPPVLEEIVGDKTYKVRSEDKVWPLLFVHTLAFFTNLVTGGQSQTWKVTEDGQLFPQLPPPIQVFYLFSHWWAQIDWTIAFPVSGLADGLPVDFKPAALESLRKLTAGEYAPYKPFADQLIAQSGLEWPIEDQTSAQSIMRSVVERVLVDPMVKFGVLECQYGKENIAGHDFTKLASIRLTSVGTGLLELLAGAMRLQIRLIRFWSVGGKSRKKSQPYGWLFDYLHFC